MSAEAFVKLFRHSKVDPQMAKYNAYSTWKAASNTWINKDRKELTALGLSKNVDFAFSQEQAKTLGAEKHFKELADQFKSVSHENIGGPFVVNDDGIDIIVFPDVNFDKGINATIKEYFGAQIADRLEAKMDASLGPSKLVKGHVFGFVSGAILGMKEELQTDKKITNSVSAEELDAALKWLDTIHDHFQELDMASSGIKNLNNPVFASYRKSSSKFLVFLETDLANRESAKKIQKFAGQSGGYTGIRGLMGSNEGTAPQIVAKLKELLVSQGFTDPQKLLNFESSPSLKKMIQDDIVSAISGDPKKLAKEYAGSKIKVGEIVINYVNEEALKRYKNSLKKAQTEIASQKKELQKAKSALAAANIAQQPISLAALQVIINNALGERIADNMGTGMREDILNFQSGRFASTVEVERMSASREGMITAFYRYMKYPYATFEPGGRQGLPKSRDPKLLISKSIREIASSIVGNRMRAVSI